MPLTKKQQEYLLNCNHRWNVKVGATGSGKSFVDMVATIPKRIVVTKGEGLIVLLGNTRGTLDRNILEPMRNLYPGLVGEIKNDNTVTIFGKKVFALGADNKKHVSRIQGASIEYCYGDEVTTWSEEVFQMLKSRLRCKHSKFDGTCNPDNPNHWFKKFLDKKDLDIFMQHYNIDDGALEPEVVSQLKQEYAGTVYYDRYILGHWKAAEGVVYKQFADNPKRYIIDKAPPIVMAIIGVDFGGNGSAHAFHCTGVTAGFKQVVTLEEYYKKEIISPAQLEQDFIDFVRICKSKYPVYEAYCDSAEQTIIQGLRMACYKAGLVIDIKNAIKGNINDRIRFYNILMGSDRYKVMSHCKHLIEAFSTVVWDSKVITKDSRLDDGTYNIDSLDAQEYSTEAIQKTILEMG